MSIEVISACYGIRKYIDHVENGGQPERCWEEDVLSAFWEQLCCYAPVDLSERKPRAITDLPSLKKQCELLEKLDVNALKKEFERVASILPSYDDDPIKVVILPGDCGNIAVNERQNGVVGTSLFGNMLIQANPLIQGYEDWIKYVFAHEYHHSIWGCYWYVLHGGEIKNTLADFLLIDGEADSFAVAVYPHLKPKWLFGLPSAEIERIWSEKYRANALSVNPDYESYMFGSEEMGIPWCAGYAVGYMLVQKYLSRSQKTSADIIEMEPERILELLEE